MRIVLLSKRRMKIRLAKGYDYYSLSEQHLMHIAGTSSKTTQRASEPRSYPFKVNSGVTVYIFKHFIGKIIK